MRLIPLIAATLAISTVSVATVRADTTAMDPNAMNVAHHMPTVSVQASGNVNFTPDIAFVTVGVNGEAPSAAAATSDVAGRANAVMAALRSLGISEGNIKTNGFNLYFREATAQARAAFVASENINVKTSVSNAGAAIDAAIRAGANQTYGLDFDTSQRDALYKQAVAQAVKQAHDLAQVAATAAGVKLGNIMSLDLGEASAPPVFGPVPMARMSVAAQPPIAPGTGTITATVSATYTLSGALHP